MITDEEIRQKIIKVLTHEFELEETELRPETRLYDDLDMDSLDAVDMVVALQKAFATEMINQQDLYEVRTIQDLFDLLIKMVHKNNNEGKEAPV
ncbi:MAG: acyl carrier protein [Thermodesulfobacteriota bacterium]